MDKMTIYHILFGRHSNIPECCIKFWLGPWAHHTVKQQYVYQTLAFPNYIPCPDCVENKRVAKIHICEKNNCHYRERLEKKLGIKKEGWHS